VPAILPLGHKAVWSHFLHDAIVGQLVFDVYQAAVQVDVQGSSACSFVSHAVKVQARFAGFEGMAILYLSALTTLFLQVSMCVFASVLFSRWT